MQRRRFMQGLLASSVTPILLQAEPQKPKNPNAMDYQHAINAITGGKPIVKSNKITIKIPEIAENGAVVPVKVAVDSPMTKNDYVKSIHILATKNSNVRCADIHFTPYNDKAFFGTRLKLGSTQEVEAIAALNDGSFISAAQQVKVTIGGCG
jgi:sulfur-oxidizing protein SoxY